MHYSVNQHTIGTLSVASEKPSPSVNQNSKKNYE